MCTKNNLSSELLELIFSYLSKYEICQCMRVCQSWYRVASIQRYEEIYAYPLYWWDCMQNLRSKRVDGSKAGDLVKSCSFAKWEEHSEQKLQDLIYIMPNLQIIKDMTTQCMQSLNDRSLLEQLPHLEEISMDSNCLLDGGSGVLLLAVNTQLKDQITSFTIKNLCTRVWGDYTKLLTSLSSFSILRNLCIGRNIESGNGAINLTSILNACRHLVSLELYSICEWEVDSTENLKHTSLSSLKLTRNYLSENHMKYMIQHIPNLKSFSLLVLDNTFEGTLVRTNPSIVSNFAIYLEKIKYLEIQREEMLVLRANGSDVYKEVSVFWKFLRELCDKDYYCDLQACVLSPNARCSATHLEKKNQHIYLECEVLWDLSNYDSWIQQLDFLTFSSIEVYGSPEANNVPLSDYVHYNWIQPLLTLLKQQQHKQVCPH